MLDVDKINIKVAKRIAKADKKAEKKKRKGQVPEEEKEDQMPRFSVKHVDDSRGDDLLAARSVSIKNVPSLEPQAIFGGPLIGINYYKPSLPSPESSLSARDSLPGASLSSGASAPDGHGVAVDSETELSPSQTHQWLQFFTWEGEKLSSPIAAPLEVNWDPTLKFVLLVYKDRGEVYYVHPEWSLACVVKESILSALWYNHSLFISTVDSVICVFPSDDPVPRVVLSSTISLTHFHGMVAVPNSPRLPIGPVSVVSVVEGVRFPILLPRDLTFSTLLC